MKHLQKTLLLALSMVSTHAVEATSDAGERMMRKQACVSSLLPFFAKTEQYRLQELNKRVYEVMQFVVNETPIKTREEWDFEVLSEIKNFLEKKDFNKDLLNPTGPSPKKFTGSRILQEIYRCLVLQSNLDQEKGVEDCANARATLVNRLAKYDPLAAKKPTELRKIKEELRRQPNKPEDMKEIDKYMKEIDAYLENARSLINDNSLCPLSIQHIKTDEGTHHYIYIGPVIECLYYGHYPTYKDR